MKRLLAIGLAVLVGLVTLPGSVRATADDATDRTISELENERLRSILRTAELLHRNDDYPGAIATFRKALALHTDDEELHRRTIAYGDWLTCRVLVRQMDPELVLGLLDDYEAWLGDTQKHPSKLWWLRSIALRRLGRNDDADRIAAEALAHEAADARYHMSIGFSLLEHRLYEPAIAELNHGLPHADDDYARGSFLLGLGVAHVGLEQFEEGVRYYEQCLELFGPPTPRSNLPFIYRDAAYACLHLGRYHKLRGKHEQTIAANERALAFEPDELDDVTRPAFARTRYAIGEAYLELGDTEQAVAALERAVEMVPDDATFWSMLGDAYAKAGDEAETHEAHAKCIELYRDDIKTNPADAAPYNGLAWHFATHDEHLDEALALSQRSLELRPDTPEFLDTLAEIYFRMGQHDKAIEWINKALNLVPKPSHLIYYEQQLAKFEKAKQSR
jgi:tetratricopeptide (TPR) repeat protein